MQNLPENETSNSQPTGSNFVDAIAELRNELASKTRKLQSLMTSVEKLQKQVVDKDSVIDQLKKDLENGKPQKPTMEDCPEGTVLPTEVIERIFYECDVKTRLTMAATCKFYRQKFQVWNDVKSLYITRNPIQLLPTKTVIPHSYLIRTNVAVLTPFQTTSIVAIAPYVCKSTRILVESSEQPLTHGCNRIPLQSGFFAYFQDAQFIKLCNVSENLSLRFNLDELLALPKLEILHIREPRIDLSLPTLSKYNAPIKQLRLSMSLTRTNGLSDVLQKLAPTLDSLELSPCRSVVPISSNLAADLLPIITETCVNLKELHVPHLISRHPSFNSNVKLLRNFSQLKCIAFDVVHLLSLRNIVNFLPQSCDTLVITEVFFVEGELFPLTSNVVLQPDKLFTPHRIELMRNELVEINRKFTIQLGRLRGTAPIAIAHKVTPNVTFISNATTTLIAAATEATPNIARRVFLFNGTVYNRKSFLERMDIVTEDKYL